MKPKIKRISFKIILFLLSVNIFQCQGPQSKITLDKSEIKKNFILEEIGNVNSKEAIEFTEKQSNMNFDFIIDDIYVGNNKYYTPAVNINVSNKQIIDSIIRKNHFSIYKLFNNKRKGRLKVLHRVDGKLKAVSGSNNPKSNIDIIRMDTALVNINQIIENLEKEKASSTLKNYKIVSAYWRLSGSGSLKLGNSYTILLILENKDGSFYKSYLTEYGFEIYGQISVSKSEFKYITTSGYKRLMDDGDDKEKSVQTYKQNNKYDLIMTDSYYVPYESNKFSSYYIKIK